MTCTRLRPAIRRNESRPGKWSDGLGECGDAHSPVAWAFWGKPVFRFAEWKNLAGRKSGLWAGGFGSDGRAHRRSRGQDGAEWRQPSFATTETVQIKRTLFGLHSGCVHPANGRRFSCTARRRLDVPASVKPSECPRRPRYRAWQTNDANRDV